MGFHPLSRLFGSYRPIPAGSIALVTGGDNGIGKAIAEELADRKCYVIIVGRDQKALTHTQQELVSQYKVKCATIRQDLSQQNGAEQVYEEVRKLGLTVDVLVNNAGMAKNAPFAELKIEDIENIINVNDLATLKLTRLILDDMVPKQRGWILTVTSLAGFIAGPGHTVYHASKAFLQNWVYGLAYELRDKGITVSSVAPGPVFETQLGDRANMGDALGMIISPGHLPAGIAKMALEGLENGVTLSLAKRHWLQTTAAKLMPQDTLMWVGQLFNYRSVPESVRQVRFKIASTLGF